MKIHSYLEPRTPVGPTLRLIERGNQVRLCAVDPDTGFSLPGGILLTISEQGVSLHPGVGTDFGFTLDREGKLWLDDLDEEQ